jgi:hypothetical protein
MALSMAILAMVYYTTQSNDTKEVVMASATQSIRGSPIAQQVMCSQEDYTEDRVRFPSCAPQRCGRFVSDSVVTEAEAKHLLSMAMRDPSLGFTPSFRSPLNIQLAPLSGTTSFGRAFKRVNSTPEMVDMLTEKDLEVYRRVTNKMGQTIATHFGIPATQLYITGPTYFVRETAATAQKRHDDYFGRHVDKQAFPYIHSTALLYLSTYGADFTGGRFIFTDQMSNHAIEPKLGRLSVFTADSENEHLAERVTSGDRYCVVLGFTCDPKFSAIDPQIV